MPLWWEIQIILSFFVGVKTHQNHMETKKFLLGEKDIPTQWYNICADMKNKPALPLHPGTRQPLTVPDLAPIFAEELCKQELNMTDTYIDIPEEVRDVYRNYRPTPLVRAYGLEKALDTPAHIYFKNESVSPVGSHKLNSAIPQAYYNKKQGITNLTTETGEDFCAHRIRANLSA